MPARNKTDSIHDPIAEMRLPKLDLSVCPPHERKDRLAALDADEFILVLGNDLRVLPVVVEALSRRFDQSGICEEKHAKRLAVAIEEAIVNAIVHGNLEISSIVREQPGNLYEKMIQARRLDPRFRHRRIHMICRFGTREGSIIVRDEGPGFDVRGLPDPTDAENLSRAYGRGILLMRAFFDKVEFGQDGNAVILIKHKFPTVSANEPIDSLIAS